jgi:hypothetical protein
MGVFLFIEMSVGDETLWERIAALPNDRSDAKPVGADSSAKAVFLALKMYGLSRPLRGQASLQQGIEACRSDAEPVGADSSAKAVFLPLEMYWPSRPLRGRVRSHGVGVWL